jgi:hypothetical protein
MIPCPSQRSPKVRQDAARKADCMKRTGVGDSANDEHRDELTTTEDHRASLSCG